MDIAMLDGVFAMLEQPLLEYYQKGSVTPKNGNHDNDMAPLGVFRTKDGYVAIACSSEKQWITFCDVLDLARLKDDERFSDNERRVQHLDALIREIENVTSTRGKLEIEALLSAHRLACGAVKTMKELVLEDEQIKARDMALNVEHPVLGKMHMMGIPIKFSKTPGDPTMLPAPMVGQDGAQILAELGYSQATIAELTERGIISRNDTLPAGCCLPTCAVCGARPPATC